MQTPLAECQVIRQLRKPFEVQQRGARGREGVLIRTQKGVPREKLLRVAQMKPDIGLRDAQARYQGNLEGHERKPQDRKGKEVAVLRDCSFLE